MDRRDEPAWTTHARRVIPGQDIVVNRDEDPEDGDLGLIAREKAVGNDNSGDSQGSSSSRTAGRGEAYEMDGLSKDDSNSQAIADDDEGDRTPPLAEYREGSHLIIERKVKDSEEVSTRIFIQLTLG
jgi:hypothetical protein